MRIAWIDFLKVFALFLVVIGHIPLEGDEPYHKWIYNFHMPLFFFVSGWLHKRNPISRDFRRLVVPYLLFNLLYLALEAPWLWRQHGSIDFLPDYLLGIVLPFRHPVCYPTWFLLSLFEAKCLMHLVHNNRQAACMALVCMAVSVGLLPDQNALPYFVAQTFTALPYYVAAMMLRPTMEGLIERYATKRRTLSVFAGGGSYILVCQCVTSF